MYRITFWAKDSNGRKSPAYIIAPHFIQGEGGSVSAVVGGKHINIKARDLISIELVKGGLSYDAGKYSGAASELRN